MWPQDVTLHVLDAPRNTPQWCGLPILRRAGVLHRVFNFQAENVYLEGDATISSKHYSLPEAGLGWPRATTMEELPRPFESIKSLPKVARTIWREPAETVWFVLPPIKGSTDCHHGAESMLSAPWLPPIIAISNSEIVPIFVSRVRFWQGT